MKRKGLLVTAALAVILGALVYLQFRGWKDFDWSAFFRHGRNAHPGHLFLAVVLIYVDYLLRAVRWKVMLRPFCRASAGALAAPTLIGFTALALLGRPGEVVRPFLIARRLHLSFASQMAVWTVERIFDVGAFTLLLAVAILFSPDLGSLRYAREAAVALLTLVAAAVLLALAIWRYTLPISAALERAFHRLGPHLGRKVAQRVQAFGDSLHTMRDLPSFLQVVGLSLLIWIFIAFAYLETTRAFPLPQITLPRVLLVIAFSMAGSVVQLPAVGGGTQLANIAVLVHVFHVPRELAVSCAVMLWIVGFMVVVPAGLALAHREHVSLRKVSAEIAAQEAAPQPAPPA